MASERFRFRRRIRGLTKITDAQKQAKAVEQTKLGISQGPRLRRNRLIELITSFADQLRQRLLLLVETLAQILRLGRKLIVHSRITNSHRGCRISCGAPCPIRR